MQVGVGRNESLRSIGRRLGRPASTIKRELDNNVENRYDGRKSGYRRKHAFGVRQSGCSSMVRYDALAAECTAAKRARRPKLSKLARHDRLRAEVQTRLQSHHSPAQIARRRLVLCGANATFARGEMVVLVGRSGTGKSTLLN